MISKRFLGIYFLILVVADQLTKWLVRTNFDLYESKNIIPGFFNITYILNPGAAFGILRTQPEMVRKAIFFTLTVVAVIFLLVLIKREMAFRLRVISYTTIIAGAVGNFIDRVYLGQVVDFFDFYYKSYHWYLFNVADCCVTIGIALLIYDGIFLEKRRRAL